jgi:dihydropteroate synthase
MRLQNKIFSVNKTLNVRGRVIDLSFPKIMGILNVTPDSFYDGKKFNDEKTILGQAERMLEDGADFIDVGGYSTRPGADDISTEEELGRVLPAIKIIVKRFPEAIISIDTFRSAVVKEAVNAGAAIINDVSGGSLDEKMVPTVASIKVPYVLMHMRGNPQTMTEQTDYDNQIKDIIDYFHSRIFQLQNHGVRDIIVDPGFGFAKTIDQNFELLGKLDQLQILGKPLMAGLSRKSLIWKTLKSDPENALNGTTALNTVALLKGASILRVHDVRQAKEAILLLQKMTVTSS